VKFSKYVRVAIAAGTIAFQASAEQGDCITGSASQFTIQVLNDTGTVTDHSFHTRTASQGTSPGTVSATYLTGKGPALGGKATTVGIRINGQIACTATDALIDGQTVTASCPIKGGLTNIIIFARGFVD